MPKDDVFAKADEAQAKKERDRLIGLLEEVISYRPTRPIEAALHQRIRHELGWYK